MELNSYIFSSTAVDALMVSWYKFLDTPTCMLHVFKGVGGKIAIEEFLHFPMLMLLVAILFLLHKDNDILSFLLLPLLRVQSLITVPHMKG